MKVGDKYSITEMVTEDKTAAKIGSGALEVFGTPYLLAMMENAALTYMKAELPDGKSTVGTAAAINHTAPSPVGIGVTVEVTVTAISENGKMVDFAMEAWDEAGPVGKGTHQRAIVDIERFMNKAHSRLG